MKSEFLGLAFRLHFLWKYPFGCKADHTPKSHSLLAPLFSCHMATCTPSLPAAGYAVVYVRAPTCMTMPPFYKHEQAEA